MDRHPEDSQTHKAIAEEAGCSQSSVSRHINRKLSGKKKCGRKQGEPQPWEDCQASPFQKSSDHTDILDVAYKCGVLCVRTFLNHKHVFLFVCFFMNQQYWCLKNYLKVGKPFSVLLQPMKSLYSVSLLAQRKPRTPSCLTSRIRFKWRRKVCRAHF